jgi:hypothetical protein
MTLATGESEGIVYHFDLGGARSSLNLSELNIAPLRAFRQSHEISGISAQVALT